MTCEYTLSRPWLQISEQESHFLHLVLEQIGKGTQYIWKVQDSVTYVCSFEDGDSKDPVAKHANHTNLMVSDSAYTINKTHHKRKCDA
jgi:hypothetical protein